jgi:hypothetical protein
MSEATPFFHDETMLMSWGESDTQGPWIKLRLPSSEALAPFRGMTKAKGDKAGQRIACAMVEIGDDERPVPPDDQWTPEERAAIAAQGKQPLVINKIGGPLARLAGMWCEDDRFASWMASTFPAAWTRETEETYPVSEWPAVTLRHICEIESRAALDHDSEAKARFDLLIRQP